MSINVSKRFTCVGIVLVLLLFTLFSSGCASGKKQPDGVNIPELKAGMIPVYYDENECVWKKADISNKGSAKWYDYEGKQWANAVTVSTSKYDDAKVGTKVLEDDVLGYWVWTPRYAYSLDKELKKFNIVFLEGVSYSINGVTVGTGDYASYKVHPAFTADASIGGWSEELTGFWVSKFEASNSNTVQVEDSSGRYVTKTTTDQMPVLVNGIGAVSNNYDDFGREDGYAVFKPNVTSWRGINIIDIEKASFEVAQNHGVDIDSHLIKNTEWGAVAYLANSDYGNLNVWTNPYNEGELYSPTGEYTFYSFTAGTITGMSGDNEDAKSAYRSEKLDKRFSGDTIQIRYKEMDSNFDLVGEYVNTYYRYNTPNGVNSSTTGNVYGVYDMSGGAWEYVAAYIENEANKYISSYFKSLDLKYVDIYKMSSEDDGVIYSKVSEKNGHTYEEMQAGNLDANTTRYGDAVAETQGFNNDHASYPAGAMPFFMRGGSAGYGDTAGIFAFGCDDGGEFNTYGFRVVLTP